MVFEALRKCGMPDLFDAPSDLQAKIFPNIPPDARVEAFTTFCPSAAEYGLCRPNRLKIIRNKTVRWECGPLHEAGRTIGVIFYRHSVEPNSVGGNQEWHRSHGSSKVRCLGSVIFRCVRHLSPAVST